MKTEKGNFFEADAQYPKKLHDLHVLPFLPERMKN